VLQNDNKTTQPVLSFRSVLFLGLDGVDWVNKEKKTKNGKV